MDGSGQTVYKLGPDDSNRDERPPLRRMWPMCRVHNQAPHTSVGTSHEPGGRRSSKAVSQWRQSVPRQHPFGHQLPRWWMVQLRQ